MFYIQLHHMQFNQYSSLIKLLRSAVAHQTRNNTVSEKLEGDNDSTVGLDKLMTVAASGASV